MSSGFIQCFLYSVSDLIPKFSVPSCHSQATPKKQRVMIFPLGVLFAALTVWWRQVCASRVSVVHSHPVHSQLDMGTGRYLSLSPAASTHRPGGLGFEAGDRGSSSSWFAGSSLHYPPSWKPSLSPRAAESLAEELGPRQVGWQLPAPPAPAPNPLCLPLSCLFQNEITHDELCAACKQGPTCSRAARAWGLPPQLPGPAPSKQHPRACGVPQMPARRYGRLSCVR